ncbi:hypothetical protein C4573_07135 [Candidatus Woesearchaeota archaeon]|nr:MAG: hypothetical protein C4573_07135 [Candidatus Woesearchaeota archaeon]
MDPVKIFGVGLAAIAYLAIDPFGFRQRAIDNLPAYVEKQAPIIMEAQEKALGIKYSGKPNFKFALPQDAEDKPLDPFLAVYKPSDTTIYLSNAKVPITSENSFTNFHVSFDIFANVYYADETIAHELGHFYVDQLNNSLQFKAPGFIADTLPDFGVRLVSEGIAEYFSRKLGDSTDYFSDSQWPILPIHIFKPFHLYEGGYHLVKPVIDNYGKEGIEYLMFHLPDTLDDIYDLPEYQKQTLEELSTVVYRKEVPHGDSIEVPIGKLGYSSEKELFSTDYNSCSALLVDGEKGAVLAHVFASSRYQGILDAEHAVKTSLDVLQKEGNQHAEAILIAGNQQHFDIITKDLERYGIPIRKVELADNYRNAGVIGSKIFFGARDVSYNPLTDSLTVTEKTRVFKN